MKRREPALRLQESEQRLAYALSGMSVVLFFLLWTPWRGGAHLVGFLIGTALMAGLAVAARQGHRLWTAFAAFLNAFNPAWSFAYILGAFFVAYAFWLGWKANRQLKATLNAPADRVRGTPLPPRKTMTIESGRVTPKGTAKRRPTKRS